MLGLKVPYENAEEAKKYILGKNLFDKRYHPVHQSNGIVFPVIREFGPPFEFDVEFVNVDAQERLPQRSLKEALENHLSEKEQEHLVTSFDTVGDIAIIEVMPELEPKKKLIAEKLLETNKNIQTVLRKAGGREGIYRTQPLEYLAGDDTRIATVVENGVRLRVNVEDAYYSVRMSTERKRILEMIRPGEHVLCLFSGVGPYPVTFSVHSKAETIVGIEINPAAHELALENIAKNRCTNVRLINGDAHSVVPHLAKNDETFDRITMPLPDSADEFIDDALSVSQKGTVLHYYAFAPEEGFDTVVHDLRVAIERTGFTLESFEVVKAGQHAPRIWRICVDAKLS